MSPAIQLEFYSPSCKPVTYCTVHHEHRRIDFSLLHGRLYIFEDCWPTSPLFFRLSNASSFILYCQVIFLDISSFLFLFSGLFTENICFSVVPYLRVCKEGWWTEHWLLLFSFNSEGPNTETKHWCRLLWNVSLPRSPEKQIHCVWPY